MLSLRSLAHALALAGCLLAAGACPAAEVPLPAARPESVGVSSERLARIDAAVRAGLERGELPGAVVLVLHRGHVVFRKAYGLRSRQPEQTLMGTEAVFDLASVTKPVATATAILLLIEQGKVRLSDRV